MRFAVLTSYLHVCCYLVFSVASRHTLAMSHQSHRYSVVDLGVSSFSLRTLHPNSRATLLMSRFFVSDGVILRSVISLVWPGVRSLANSACLPTLMCRGVGSIPVCTPKAPFFFAHKTGHKFEKKTWFTTWQPGSKPPPLKDSVDQWPMLKILSGGVWYNDQDVQDRVSSSHRSFVSLAGLD